MPPRTWLIEVGVGLRASGRPSPSAGKYAGLCPLPRIGGGEGNRGDLSLSPKRIWRAGGEGQGEGRLLARMPPRTWLMEVGVGLRASRRPSPSAGENAGLCPLPRRGGGEGNRAYPLPIHSVLKVLTSHFPLRTFFCPLTTPPTYPRFPPACDTALVPLHRGRASKAFWCGGGIGRSGNHCGHAPHILGGRRDPL